MVDTGSDSLQATEWVWGTGFRSHDEVAEEREVKERHKGKAK
jgi:hypothetical protein